MDQNTQQTTATPTTEEAVVTTPPQGEVIIGGAFGGTVPTTQEAISETMPSFSFDEAEFGGEVQPVTTVQQELIHEPLANASPTNISLDDLPQTHEIIENSTPDTVIGSPEDSEGGLHFTNPDSDESINGGDIVQDTGISSDPMPNFDLPLQEITGGEEIVGDQSISKIATSDTSLQETLDPQSETNPEKVVEQVTDEAILFDLPVDKDTSNNEESSHTENDMIQPINDESIRPEVSEPISLDDFSLPDIENNKEIVPPETDNTIQADEQSHNGNSEFDLPLQETSAGEAVTGDQSISEIATSNSDEQKTPKQPQEVLSIPTEQITQESQPENTLNTTAEQATDETISFDLPVDKDTSKEEIKLNEQPQDKEISKPETDNKTKETQDDTTINEQNNEVYANNTHELSDSYEEFNTALTNYLSFLDADTVNLLGLRTDEDEVNYTFTKEYDQTILVEKSTTGDIINFVPTESGLEILLNNESIAYYGVDKVSKDITHYLKEKLGKFTMMVSSEHEKQEKAKKEENKRIKETLRSF